jgi:glucose-6-phosphate dehydrogenase assembly protein OpcA
MTPATVDEAGHEYPERVRWVAEGVTADEVHAELDRLHRAAGGPDRVLALARTLNLIVGRCPESYEPEVDRTLDELGSHTPSRTLVLREHGESRVDASLVMECDTPPGAGRVGLCHDRVVLTMDPARLEHSESLLAPLIVSDLPTVLWLPASSWDVPDPRLLERAQYVLVDSASGEDGELPRLAKLAASIRVHDLAWGRLAYWRAAIAATFEHAVNRALLPEITDVRLRYEWGGLRSALLLAGWIVARAGWRPVGAERSNGTIRAKAVRDGGEVGIELAEADCTGNCGGVDGLRFSIGSEAIDVDRSGATTKLRDMFAEALQPEPSYARGYAPAVTAAAATLGEAA